ncbi:MAG: serine acetyltransferase [Geobacteraceae bacterium GWC2_58_44]|nr:MAG: serine acetyltransferase [Geobacteraceae bacterium GWC2_58_44]HBG05063.1 serine acetyltransferase [Geobacter sp.]
MKGEKEKIFVFGASGHAKVVIDIIERQGSFDIAFLVDDNVNVTGRTVSGYPVIGGKGALLASGIRRGIVAIVCNDARYSVVRWCERKGFELVSAVHPGAHVARDVPIGVGSVVMAGAVINSDSSIGRYVIINTRAGIDHDCCISDGAHVAPGVSLCGTVGIGELTFVGAGATVIQNISIGNNVVVGAGATVISDVPDRVLVLGSPAKVKKRF